MNVSSTLTKEYENISDWTLGENKPNSNPIKPNFKRAKMNANDFITKDYRKKDDFVVRINKPNSNPISEKPKMNVNLYVIEDYENKTAFGPKKTNPIQTQFPKGQNEQKIACHKIWPHPNRFISEIPVDNTRQVLDNSFSVLQDFTTVVVLLRRRKNQPTQRFGG